jgi:hypothetical protein
MSDAAERLSDDDRIPTPDEERPQWLVDADEITKSGRVGDEDPAAPSTRFHLISAGDQIEQTPVHRPPPARPAPGAPAEPEKPRGPVTWTAAASSVPTLKVESAAEGAKAAPPQQQQQQAPSRHDALEPEEDGDGVHPLSTFDDNTAEVRAARPVVAAPLRAEPWWVIAMDALRGDTRIQVLSGLIVLGAVVLTICWPRTEPGISLRTLRKDPARWDSQRVKVQGKVGDVFSLGGGYAFYLLQGRDTMVVFTRSRVPVTGKHTTVVGNVSTGFLDGAPRQAIFDESQP